VSYKNGKLTLIAEFNFSHIVGRDQLWVIWLEDKEVEPSSIDHSKKFGYGKKKDSANLTENCTL
jgi:hypothetical protein